MLKFRTIYLEEVTTFSKSKNYLTSSLQFLRAVNCGTRNSAQKETLIKTFTPIIFPNFHKCQNSISMKNSISENVT